MDKKEYLRQYYLKNKEKIKQQNADNQKRNRKQRSEYWNEWAKKNKSKIKAHGENWRLKDGLGVYMLWNKIDKCVDRVGEGQLNNRLQTYKCYQKYHPQQINDNVEKYGFDNVYDFIVLHRCETKEECQRLETIEINKLQPRYNTEKIEQ